MLLIFDIDGTLTHSIVLHQKALKEAMHQSGLKTVNTDWASYKHHTDSWVFQESFFQNHKQHATEKDLQYFEQCFDDCYAQLSKTVTLELIGGTADCLQELEKQGIPFCFATGSLRSAAIHKLSCIPGIINAPLLATASEADTREKIISNAIHLASQYYGIPEFERMISIGDGIWDLKAAQALSLDFIGIAEAETKTRLLDAGAEHVITNFYDPLWNMLISQDQ